MWYLLLTDDHKHHADTVLVFTENVYEELKGNGIEPERVEFTDGSSCQYKGNVSFRDLAESEIPTDTFFRNKSWSGNLLFKYSMACTTLICTLVAWIIGLSEYI